MFAKHVLQWVRQPCRLSIRIVPLPYLETKPHFTFYHAPNIEFSRLYASKRLRKEKKGMEDKQPKPQIIHPHQKQYAVLMDGDVTGPTHWAPLLDAVRASGHIRLAKVFAAAAGPKWSKMASTHGIEIVEVKRREGGLKDPNDLVIALEAGRLASAGSVNSVALAAQDYDFTVIAEHLKEWGFHVALVITEGSRFGLRNAFQQIGAEILTYVVGEGLVSPKFKAVLRLDGNSTFEPNDGPAVLTDNDSKNNAVEHLMRLGFLEEPDFPLVPAIAKFYHANQIGRLTVWPDAHALFEFTQLLSATKRQVKWSHNPGGLIFVCPRALDASKTKKKIQDFGTARCYTMVQGGGPFIVQDSEHVTKRILTRLAYLDNHYNKDIGEAVNTFSQTGENCAKLKQLAIFISSEMQDDNKVELLRKAFLSSSGYGQWAIPAKDIGARRVLFRKGIIKDLAISTDDMLLAMERYALQENLHLWSTYNARVLQILHQDRARHTPQLRGHQSKMDKRL